MKHTIRILLFLFISTSVSHAQILKGRIINQSGDPIPYSTVYIQELKQGTTSNTRGDYELKLPAGKYTVMYQSLGFEPVIFSLSLSDSTITKNVVLPVQYYQIPEVRITASGEDPAYGIMRKAIGLAPYYLNNISHYKADVYLKGNLVINKIPKLIKKQMEREAKKESGNASGKKTMNEGDVYLMESYNEIEFNAPDKYVQKVVSFNSTFPEEGNEISPMQYISASFYQPVIGDMAISPLAPNAFSHYNFKYLGASPQGNYVINKIQVIPKRKSQQLLEGTIYIIDDLWCLQSVDLTNENLVGKIRVQQLYIPVQDDFWMPVSHKFEVNIGIMGFKADAGYAVSVKYNDVKPNLALQRPKILSTAYTARTVAPVQADTSRTKTKKQIEKILEKDELSNRDMIKLSRLMEKESEKSVDDSIRNNLEIKDKTTHIIEKDAAKKDSAYWAEIRPIPLSEPEMRSIKLNDSIRTATELRDIKADTASLSGKKEKSKFVVALKDIGLGKTWSDTTGFSFTYGGLIDMKNLTFNTVDGLVYGLDFRLSKSWKDNRSLSLFPDIRYAFARNRLMWKINASYKYNGMKQKEIFLRTGMASRDIGNGGGINPLLNTASTLMFEENYLKLYESDFLTLGYRSEIVNGLSLELASTYELRKVLENNTDFSIINTSREYSDNIPDNDYLSPEADPVHGLRDQYHASIAAKLTYIPRQKYRIEKGRKIPAGSGWPTFSLSWEHGINDFRETGEQVNHYDMIRAEVSRSHETGAFGEFRWRVRAGGFLDNRQLTFYDFFHFNPQEIPVLINDYEDAFMLPGYYSTSTPEAFGELHLKYTTPYLLLKLLPGLSNTLIRENLLMSYLGSRYHPNYTELGYSMSEIFFFAELGVYVGFEDLKYKSFGAKLILKID
jgi:hypothetical protein